MVVVMDDSAEAKMASNSPPRGEALTLRNGSTVSVAVVSYRVGVVCTAHYLTQ